MIERADSAPQYLARLQRAWDELGSTDPLWAILTYPEKQGNKWDRSEFFATGEQEVSALISYVWSLGFGTRHGKALDFGCGVGRLTQALCRYYDHVWGVDIAPSMLELAASYNLQGETCTYVLNVRDDLSLFPDGEFDLIYSKITLQHIQPACSARYIREFLRIVASGGVAVFQIPSRPLSAESLVLGRDTAGVPDLDETAPATGIFGIDREAVVQFVRDNGGTMVDIQKDQGAGPQWESFRYCATKQA